LEDNEGINQGIAAMGGQIIKKYRIYEKPLAQGTLPWSRQAPEAPISTS
jgi:hypothetical protein